MRNWKTTLAGILTIAGVVGKLLTGHTPDASDLTAVIAGVGLIAAKDFDVSHSKP